MHGSRLFVRGFRYTTVTPTLLTFLIMNVSLDFFSQRRERKEPKCGNINKNDDCLDPERAHKRLLSCQITSYQKVFSWFTWRILFHNTTYRSNSTYGVQLWYMKVKTGFSRGKKVAQIRTVEMNFLRIVKGVPFIWTYEK